MSKRLKNGAMTGLLCSVTGCTRKAEAKFMCMAHWARFRKNGEIKAWRPITKSKFGSENGRWKGGEIGDGHGRVLIYAPSHPHPSYCGTHVYRYRLVMEQHLGRYLKPDEIVHHINGICNDDRIENLELMNQSQHCKRHNFGGDHCKL